MNMEAMVKRDRNHPSVVICSYCNENGCGPTGGSAFRNATYRYDDSRPTWLPPCCVFRRPHHPPTPTFLDDLNKTELPSPSPINGSAARWWRERCPRPPPRAP